MDLLLTSMPLIASLAGVSIGVLVILLLLSAPLPAWTRRSPWPDLALALSGLGSLVAYSALILRSYPLVPHFESPELLDVVKMAGATGDAARGFFASFLIVFVLYGMAARFSRTPTGRAGRAVIFLVPCAASAILLFTYPITAGDVYDYVMSGRTLWLYGQNPLTVAPEAFAGDPMYRSTGWQWRPAPYGPLWALAAGGLTWLAGDSLLANLLAFKLLAAASLLGTAFLVYHTVRHARPSEALASFCLLAWNPLLLVEAAANAHNDFFMALLATLAVDLLLRGRRVAALPVLAASVLVKYASALLLPPFLLYLLLTARDTAGRKRPLPILREMLARVAPGLLLAAVLCAAIFYPFWEGGAALQVVREQGEFFTSSPATLLYISLYETGLPDDQAREAARRPLYLAFAVMAALRLARLRASRQSLISTSQQIVFLYLLLAAVWFQPWYLAWLLPLAVASADLREQRRAAVFSFTATMIHLVTGFGWRMGWGSMDQKLLLGATLLLVFAWPVFLWTWDGAAGWLGGNRRAPGREGYPRWWTRPSPCRAEQSHRARRIPGGRTGSGGRNA